MCGRTRKGRAGTPRTARSRGGPEVRERGQSRGCAAHITGGEASRRAGGGDLRHGLAHALSCKNRIFAGGHRRPRHGSSRAVRAALAISDSTLTLE
nr:hypothetical protein pFRL5_49 [Streptomyces sp. F8]